MFSLIIGVALILVGSFGLDLARRRRSGRNSVAKGGEAVANATIPQHQLVNTLLLVGSAVLVLGGLATAFV